MSSDLCRSDRRPPVSRLHGVIPVTETFIHCPSIVHLTLHPPMPKPHSSLNKTSSLEKKLSSCNQRIRSLTALHAKAEL